MHTINSALDVEALARDYAERRRLQVRDFLSEESAERIFHHLSTKTP